MSSPINGISNRPINQLTAAANPGAAATSGASFAQVAAAAGLAPPPPSSGTGAPSGAPGSSGATGTGSGSPPQGSSGTTGSPQGAAPNTASGTAATQGTGLPGQSGAGGLGAATGTGATTGTAASTGASTIADLSGTDTFLKLLVAQLKNQDPTSPMDNQAFVTELAQFNTVEQMINLKQAITTQTTTQEATEGIGLLGRNISYAAPSVNGNKPLINHGVVTGVNMAGGQVSLQVGAKQVALNEVTAVTG
jgi:flagellar basal-body rod modification protein FlgD